MVSTYIVETQLEIEQNLLSKGFCPPRRGGGVAVGGLCPDTFLHTLLSKTHLNSLNAA